MVAKELAKTVVHAMVAVVLAAAFALALSGCSLLEDDHSSTPAEGSAAALFGLPRLPAAQAMTDVSPNRAVEVLGNFEYRNHNGEGQWVNTPLAFDVLDNGTQATLEAPIAADADATDGGAACWVMMLSSYDGTAWKNLALTDIEAGADPERATLVVFPQRGLTFTDKQKAAEFLDALFASARGVFVIGSDGCIAKAVLKATTGGVCEVVQEEPGLLRLAIHPKPQWSDGTYDDCVAECKKYAEENACQYGEFTKVVPLFEEPRIELAK